jgi:hypothetical protein
MLNLIETLYSKMQKMSLEILIMAVLDVLLFQIMTTIKIPILTSFVSPNLMIHNWDTAAH